MASFHSKSRYFNVLCLIFSLLGMSEEDVRDALLTWVSQRCCYGSQAAQHMYIKKIEPTMALYVSCIHTHSFTCFLGGQQDNFLQ